MRQKKTKKNKKSSPSAFPGTRGRDPFPSARTGHLGKAASSPSALFWHSGKGLFPECQGRHSGKIFFKKSFNGVDGVNRQVTCFFVECRSSPSVALGKEGLYRVLLCTECQDLFGTRKSLSSLSVIIPRVQHSGKILFPECPIFNTRRSQRHSENFTSPIVFASHAARAASVAASAAFKSCTTNYKM